MNPGSTRRRPLSLRAECVFSYAGGQPLQETSPRDIEKGTQMQVLDCFSSFVPATVALCWKLSGRSQALKEGFPGPWAALWAHGSQGQERQAWATQVMFCSPFPVESRGNARLSCSRPKSRSPPLLVSPGCPRRRDFVICHMNKWEEAWEVSPASWVSPLQGNISCHIPSRSHVTSRNFSYLSGASPLSQRVYSCLMAQGCVGCGWV